ncbi:unnamed protein product, partial [Citrullus colocynthis]
VAWVAETKSQKSPNVVNLPMVAVAEGDCVDFASWVTSHEREKMKLASLTRRKDCCGQTWSRWRMKREEEQDAGRRES